MLTLSFLWKTHCWSQGPTLSLQACRPSLCSCSLGAMGCGIASQTWASLCLCRGPGRAGLCSGRRAACGFGLFCRFQRNVLDLSLQWRFANLPNNAKLEMVPISRSREGPENMVGGSQGGTGFTAPAGSSIQTIWAAGCISRPSRRGVERGLFQRAVQVRHLSSSLGEAAFSRLGQSHFSTPKADDWK